MKQMTLPIKFTSALTAFTILASCGGGGADVSEGVNNFGSTQIIKMYPSDGSGVSISEHVSANSHSYNATFLVSDTTKAADLADAVFRVNNGLSELVEGESNPDRSYFAVHEGVNDKGKIFTVTFGGESFGDKDYVSINLVAVDDQYFALGTDGSVLTRLPTGAHTYRGVINIGGGATGDDIEIGNFTMSTNFIERTASISGTTANKFLTANALNISGSGKISGNGVIGIVSSNTLDAKVTAFLAGENGDGVHGLAYQTDDVENGMAATFIATK